MSKNLGKKIIEDILPTKFYMFYELQKPFFECSPADVSWEGELLDKAETCTLELRRIHFICTVIYKIINIKPEYMNSLIIHNESHSSRRPLNLFMPRINQTIHGLISFCWQGTVLWNSLPEETKTASNLNSLESKI